MAENEKEKQQFKCSVEQCSTTGPSSSFTKLPTKEPRRQKWISVLGLKKINSNVKICKKRHFISQDFADTGLRKHVIPSRNSPNLPVGLIFQNACLILTYFC